MGWRTVLAQSLVTQLDPLPGKSPDSAIMSAHPAVSETLQSHKPHRDGFQQGGSLQRVQNIGHALPWTHLFDIEEHAHRNVGHASFERP